MPITRNHARQLRLLLLKKAETLPDEVIVRVPNFVEKWECGVRYETGKRLNYNDIVYKVLQDHTSQEDWTPDSASSLYARVLIPDPTVINDWEQPDSTNPYMTGDKVRHNGTIWVSSVDNNVWAPGIYGWEVLHE